MSAYAAACLSPNWGLRFESASLVPWSAVLLIILGYSLWHYLQPVKPANTDFIFVLSLSLSVNLFSSVLDADRQSFRYMYFLIVALCSLYYPLKFNFLAASLMLGLEGSNTALLGKTGGSREFVGLSVFGAYLFGAALILGHLFQSEHRKKERAVQAMRRMQEGAYALGDDDDDAATVKAVSPDGRMNRKMETAAELDSALYDLLESLRSALPSQDAMLFMQDSEGKNVYLRVWSGSGNVIENAVIPVGQGLVGWVAKEKGPVLVREKARGLGYIGDEDASGSFIAVPVMNGGVLEGVLALDSPGSDIFGEEDKETLSRFARVVVYLLQKARAYRQVDISAQTSAALHAISSQISSSLDIDVILDNLARLSKEVVPYDYLTVTFIEGQNAVFVRAIGYDGMKIPEGAFPVAGSYLGWIVENRHEFSFSDRQAGKMPVFPGGVLKTDSRSFLGIPLKSQEKVIGVLTVASREAAAITAYHHEMLKIVANQAAVNITNAKLHNVVLRMATTDGLTGLINHRHFQEKADEEFRRVSRYPQPVSVLMFDIDHFKKINDAYGHPVGDAVLKKVANILMETVRTVDVAARYGGEEFVALLGNTDAKGAGQMAERIRGKIEKARFTLEGKGIPVTVSVGYATSPDDGTTKQEIMERADQALYHAKRSGRNRSCSYKETLAGAARGA